MFCAKNGFKKHLILEKWQVFENRRNRSKCMGYSLCKMLSLVQNFKKGVKNVSRSTLELFFAKNELKNTQYLKSKNFVRNSQNWPQFNGYRLSKMVSFAQKLSLLKTCQKRLYRHIRVVLCKKRFQKRSNIRERTSFWKWRKLATGEYWRIFGLTKVVKLFQNH